MGVSFVDRNQCWSAEQREAAHRLVASIKEHELDVVRFSFAD
jgi:hypothetical protein